MTDKIEQLLDDVYEAVRENGWIDRDELRPLIESFRESIRSEAIDECVGTIQVKAKEISELTIKARAENNVMAVADYANATTNYLVCVELLTRLKAKQ